MIAFGQPLSFGQQAYFVTYSISIQPMCFIVLLAQMIIFAWSIGRVSHIHGVTRITSKKNKEQPF